MDCIEKQLAFALEIDKVKIYSGKHIYLETEEMRMMQSTPGIWQSWHIFFGNMPMKK